MAKTSKTMLDSSGETGHPCLVPDFRGNAFNFWFIIYGFYYVEECWASLVAQTVKRLPAVQETRVQSLGREDPLEKEMATDSSILAWKIP